MKKLSKIEMARKREELRLINRGRGDVINRAWEAGIQRGYENAIDAKKDPSILKYYSAKSRRKLAKLGIK